MENPELNDLEGNGKKRVNANRLYFAIFLILFLTLPMGYYIWMRSECEDIKDHKYSSAKFRSPK